MTEVEFHTGVTDRVGFTCRLLRKALRRNMRVLLTAPAPALAEMDRALWTFEEREFLPHIRVPGATEAVRERTPIWLATSADAIAGLDGDAPRLLVNLGGDAPCALDAIDRLIEVVSAEPEEAARGRERWRAYKAAGLLIVHHTGSEARG
jgi:DNA polymerase-3 subunit chi